jgi:hypothetical protein
MRLPSPKGANGGMRLKPLVLVVDDDAKITTMLRRSL